MRFLRAAAPGFAAAFRAIVTDTRAPVADMQMQVAAIIADVRAHGFPALASYSERFDGVAITPDSVEIGAGERRQAIALVPAPQRRALELAASRILAFHQAQKPKDGEVVDALGVRAGWRWTPVERAGLYVPGGRASYPSSVLMNAIPAKVAGVDELVMATPTPGGALNPLVMLAAELAGIDRLFRLGGAQAIAALAYGAGPVPPCAMIVGPGNAWVAEAKRQLYGTVGIDMVAGPSEILVIADDAAPPAFVAADLLSQSEHDPVAQAILITDSSALAEAVIAEVGRQLPLLATEKAARQSWDDYGVVILVEALDDAVPLADALAAEHVELAVRDPEALFRRLRHAGSVFFGLHTPEPMGDYLGGPNHVLPTGRRARFSGGLGVHNFMKRTTFLDTKAGFAELADAVVTLAEAEGLPAHANAVRVRLNRGK